MTDSGRKGASGLDDSVREALSAYLDDEADELALQRILKRGEDAEVRACLSRYQAVRSVLGADPSAFVQVDVLAGVRAAIAVDGEPAAVAVGGHIQPVASARSRMLGMAAIAASLTFAVLLGIQSWRGVEPTSSLVAVTPSVQTAPSVASTDPGGVAVPNVAAVNEQQWKEVDWDGLNAHLLWHGREAGSALNGLGPMTRVVSMPVPEEANHAPAPR